MSEQSGDVLLLYTHLATCGIVVLRCSNRFVTSRNYLSDADADKSVFCCKGVGTRGTVYEETPHF
ncbi:MAG: hypothetical protein E7649_03700 [Ruminococcaceae bacterium]|nr:hypothetical protein [Oscillospiraceae bacterium]